MGDIIAIIAGVVSSGLKVIKSLTDAAHDMVHAQDQIISIKTHVHQFNNVLKQLAWVLETNNNICSQMALHDIDDICQTCRKTFQEIKTTVESKCRSRFYMSLRWLFKKEEAKEIEVRLDAQKSTLQTMIQTIILIEVASKYVHMEQTYLCSDISRSANDTNYMSKLFEELNFIKEVIME